MDFIHFTKNNFLTKNLFMYIQMLEDLEVSVKGTTILIDKDDIIPIIEKLDKGPFFNNETKFVYISKNGHEFYLKSDRKYRELTEKESKLYLQNVVVTKSFDLIPTETELKHRLIHKKHIRKARVGETLQVCGFTENLDKTYSPYTVAELGGSKWRVYLKEGHYMTELSLYNNFDFERYKSEHTNLDNL